MLSVPLILGALYWWTIRHGTLPADTQIRIRYSVIVQNKSKTPLKQAKIKIQAPVFSTGTQLSHQIQASHPCRIEKDPLGNQTIEIQWDLFAPFSSKIVTVQSDLDIWRQSKTIGRIDADTFLAPEPLIESDGSDMQLLAGQLAAKTTEETVRRIFDWVSTNVTYSGYVKRNRGARYALIHRKGDCTEYTSLFVALCRANGIPARPVGGFICPNSMVVDVNDYHNWAEFYLDGRWRIADPQKKQLMTDESNYIAFEIMRPSRPMPTLLVSKIEGTGLEVTHKRRRRHS